MPSALLKLVTVLLLVVQMERAGEIARTEAKLFRIEKATKASDLAVLESRAHESDLRLRQLMGMSPDAPLRFRAMGVGPPRASAAQRNDPAELKRRSPTMLVAATEYEAAEKTLELEIRKQYPDLYIGPGFGREDGQDQMLLGLSIPIPILNANRQRIAKARVQRELARAGVEATHNCHHHPFCRANLTHYRGRHGNCSRVRNEHNRPHQRNNKCQVRSKPRYPQAGVLFRGHSFALYTHN